MKELSQIKDYASKNSVPIMFDEGIEFIIDYIKKNDVSFILEIGTAIGYSAIKFAQINSNIRVFTIEYDIERYHEAVKNIVNFKLDDQITVFLGDALNFNFTEKFDLIFIDGAKSQYVNFFEKYKNNLNEKGVIISDNLFFHGMVENPKLTQNYSTIKLIRKLKRYIDFLKSNTEFETTFYEIGDGVAVSRRK
ncbi:MAG: O-methyltransferase [Spirochaetaceae bacterium]|nr:O-methyltransferase [Spirochaetaceae bacterium]